jgi:hypothetical protein
LNYLLVFPSHENQNAYNILKAFLERCGKININKYAAQSSFKSRIKAWVLMSSSVACAMGNQMAIMHGMRLKNLA